ncbi:hypothetical protein KEU06_06855 [Pseudaminobacter sp. 19-2017]|uniref:Uncharacterized protein n=1 Tax=Pseudaminobacter soli (ex Zhang et al. 2022) TaxID=2831468 RepID=A0A942DWG2_9HYPH|nr:hypothetical protein [Pseudaminobacter soli]MBS3648346.1 hypothetical protein [Pseudaminobacter soli]
MRLLSSGAVIDPHNKNNAGRASDCAIWDMRTLFVVLITILTVGIAVAAPAQPTKEGVLNWINNYQPKRDLRHVPVVMKAASDIGLMSDPDSAGMYVGFMAGVIGSNPKSAGSIVKKLTVMRETDHWAIVRAIAYSGHPDWRGLMTRSAPKSRAVMAQRYLEGKLPTLNSPPPPEKRKSWKDRANPTKWFAKKDKDEEEIPLDERPEMLDVYWGYYFASRSPRPVARMVTMLPWAEERDSVEKLTMGSMAKFTIAMKASRDPKLLALLKDLQKQQTDKKTSKQLAEAIEAAETVEISTLRKTAYDRLEELKRLGPGSKRDMSMWGKIGQGVISLGCVTAAATGQVYLGVPCVVGGAATSGLLYYFTGP